MYRKTLRCAYAVLMAAMMVLPVLPGLADESRAPPNIVMRTTTFSGGASERTVRFSESGSNSSLSLSFFNGATVLKASMNVSNGPYTDGGNDYPDNVTIDFGQDGMNEWAFSGKGLGSFGRQQNLYNASGAVSHSKMYFTGAGTNSSTKIRLPKTAVVESASINMTTAQRLGTPKKILVLYGDTPKTNFYADIVSRLSTFNNDFTRVDSLDAFSSTPDWNAVKDYSGILIYSNPWWGYGFQNAASVGDLMARYVDSGGALVLCLGAICDDYGYFLGGRFQSEGYYALAPSWLDYCEDWGYNIEQSDHPVMEGVSSLGWWNYGYTYVGYQPDPANGAKNIATYNYNGYSMVAEKNINGVNRVDINFFPWSFDADYDVGYSGDGETLMRNAILYAGPTPMDVRLDIAGDGSIEYSNESMMGSAIVSGFADQLNTYLSKAAVTYTDSYGNKFVDIPVAVTSAGGGSVNISHLDVTYSYGTRVDVNPSTGDLAGALNGLISSKADGGTTDIVMEVSSGSAGKVRVSDLMVEWRPPDHWAIIGSRTPAEETVEMDENSTVEFAIEASDAFGYPMNASWYLNSMVMVKNSYNMTYYADYDANGTYNVSVKVDNGLHQTIASWELIVRNANRRPVVNSMNPPDKVQMSEASSTIFEVSASDPDGDPLNYTWAVDNKPADAYDVQYEYFTGYAAAGQHTVKAVVRDDGGLNASAVWTVTVQDVNVDPEILDSSPAGNDVVMNENEVRRFSVVDFAVDGDKLTDIWSLDGVTTGVMAKSYNYSADYNSSGRHVVEVEVSDGKLSVKRNWNVTVNDVNRPPVPVIDSPNPGTEYMTWDDITFTATPTWDPDNDALNLSWSDGKKVVGYGTSVTVHLTRGKHMVTLTANDGKRAGIATATVEVTVRYLDFAAVLVPDRTEPVEGQTVKLSVQLTNKGDGGIGELPVHFLVDGIEVTSQTVEDVEPNGDYQLEFSWKAVKGDHKLQVQVMNQNFSRSLTVTRKPAPAPLISADLMLMAGAVAAVAAVGVGAFLYASRRKGRAAAAQQVPAAPAASAASAAATSTAPAPAPGGPAEEARAMDLIKRTEALFANADAIGMDTAQARQKLAVAKNFYEMGKYSKAIEYCDIAQEMMG